MFPIVLGTAKFNTFQNRETSYSLLDTFVNSGGRRLDTANNYACWHPDGEGGESETLIGEWMAERGRDSVEVMTKIGAMPTDGLTYDNLDGLSASNIKASVDACLNRLQTDRIDVLYAHVDDHRVPLLETWTAMSDLVRQGIVGELGISNYNADRVTALESEILAHGLTPFKYAQYRYSLITPNFNRNFAPQVLLDETLNDVLHASRFKPEILTYSALLDGHLEEDPDELPEEYDNLLNIMMVEDMQAKAKNLDVSVSAFILKTISDYGYTPITTSTNPTRMMNNLALFTNFATDKV
ncbi:aldo/keto reductase [Veronia pacifica]|uniref:Aldo/keto reductase n=1 Tax=Veronia pacifica TaxID=1080227 RepID=A0A1C3ED88_9GAMM|nr:aldo/keto reductase [Veronia pacifica]ODA31212.1 aldo/keto reductase [Veronia pacifica]